MSADTTLAENRTDEILIGAVDRQTPVLVSHRTATGWRAYHARFTQANPQARTIGAALFGGDDHPSAVGFVEGSEIGVTFRRARKKCMFSTSVLEVAPGQTGQFVIRWPDRILELQRRVFERTATPPGKAIPVKLWKLTDAPNGPVAEDNVLTGTLEDLSVGGVRIRAVGVRSLCLDATYCCKIGLGPHGQDLTIEAVLRHHEAPQGGTASLGFCFIGLETTEAGRQKMITIARTVSRLQRRHTNAAKIRLHRRRRSR